ncbi:MAG: pitrilysin family protein [Terriglobia bacterium]|jgi:zinc protease
MRPRIVRCSLLAILLGLAAFAPRASAQATDWKQIKAPTLHAFHPQQPRRVEFANGMIVLLQEDHELPLVRGTAEIRGGSRSEPAGKVGLVQIYGQAWRTGGAKNRTGDQLDDYLEANAAKVETSGGADSTTVSWDCLKDNFDEVFKVFVEVLREPEFRPDKVDLAKRQINTAISRRNDEPFGIAFREAAKLVYGADSPYAREPEYATVAAVTRDDLLNWHQQYVHPNNIILGVEGDFDSSAMEAKLHGAFDSWQRGPEAPKLQASLRGTKPGIYFVAKDDVTASTVQMVGLGTTRNNPDYYAIEVFNQFFGGSFSSRLFSNIRSKKGLAYAVGGGIGTDYDHPGVLRLYLGTKSSTTAAAIDAFNVELDALKTNPATPEELTKAKEAILNSFVFRFDSKEKVLRERMTYEFYGYPADFLERYREGIAKVSIEDVSRVAAKYVHKDQLATLVVGKAADFDKPLSTYGPVTTLDIAIPPPPGAAKAANASNSAGQALIAKVIESLGGAAKVRSVKALREKSTVLAKTPQGEMSIDIEEIAAFPDQLWQKMHMPMGEMTMVISPSVAFMKSPMGSQDLPGAQKEDGLKELKRHPIFVAQHVDDPKFIFAAGGTEKIGDVEAQILDINADGAQVRWYVDPQSGHILRTSAQTTGMGGPGEQVVDYSEWKDVEGLSLPFKLKIKQSGNDAGSQDIHELQINPAVDPKLFEKPAAGTSTGN